MRDFPQCGADIAAQQFGELLAVEDAFADIGVLQGTEALRRGEEVLGVQTVCRNLSGLLERGGELTDLLGCGEVPCQCRASRAARASVCVGRRTRPS